MVAEVLLGLVVEVGLVYGVVEILHVVIVEAVLAVGLLLLLLVVVVLAVLLVLKLQYLTLLLTLLFGEAVEGMEVGLEVLYDGLVYDGVLKLRGQLVALEDEEDEVLQEVLLLAEVLLVLHVCYLERVH